MANDDILDAKDGGLVIPYLRIAFNNNGQERFHEISGDNQDVIDALAQFLIDMNNNGISPPQETLDKLFKDVGCTDFDEDARDERFIDVIALPRTQEDAIPCKESLENLQNTLAEHDRTISETTIKELTPTLGLLQPVWPMPNTPEQS